LFELLEDTSYDDEHIEHVVDKHVPEITQAAHADSDASPPSSYVEEQAKLYALLERLLRRKHWGPFEHPSLTVAFKNVSVQTERQLTRHRHATFDVQSLRYVDVGDDHSMVVPKSADADHATRHGVVDMDDADRKRANEILDQAGRDQQQRYVELRDLGMPAEDARVLLGIGTQINMTMTANLRTYLHILNLRASAGDAQWEIRGLGSMLKDELRDWAPMTIDLWERHGPFVDGP
jgi:thymidylate synthase (FAD)